MVRVLSVRAFGLSACLRLIGIVILMGAMLPSGGAWAQKQGGVLRVAHRDSPSSMSIHEEGTISVVMPAMGVFNNLVMFDPKVRQNSLEGIVPDLATKWTWSEDGKTLTFALREGVKWHDGKPFTAADVKCTFDLLAGTAPENFKVNFRKGWYANVEKVTTNGDFEAVVHLKTPQPALLALLASGFTPVYPCHVSPAEMRRAPIGTGPFKFVEYKPNQSIKVVRNPTYWKPGRPYLDGIDYTIIANRSTAILSFVSGKFDMTFPFEITVPLLKDVKAQMPTAQCDMSPMNVAANLLMNPVPPFDNRRDPPRRRHDHRPQGLRRHHDPGRGRRGQRHAARARRTVGLAARDAARDAGLRSRRRQEPREGARHHGRAWLRAEQADQAQAARPATCRPTAMRQSS